MLNLMEKQICFLFLMIIVYADDFSPVKCRTIDYCYEKYFVLFCKACNYFCVAFFVMLQTVSLILGVNHKWNEYVLQ